MSSLVIILPGEPEHAHDAAGPAGGDGQGEAEDLRAAGGSEEAAGALPAEARHCGSEEMSSMRRYNYICMYVTYIK